MEINNVHDLTVTAITQLRENGAEKSETRAELTFSLMSALVQQYEFYRLRSKNGKVTPKDAENIHDQLIQMMEMPLFIAVLRITLGFGYLWAANPDVMTELQAAVLKLYNQEGGKDEADGSA